MAIIGFVGLGHMGLPMVGNLIKGGHTLQVFDLNEKALEAAKSLGAVSTSNATAVADNADFVFTMLQEGAQVKSVCLGDEGIFNILKEGAVFIDSSSIDIVDSREIHQIAKEQNIKMCDAPVSGGVKGAENASLTFMVGGDEGVFNEVNPILSLMGANVIHAGVAGNGQAAKICNNMILGISMIAVSEAFTMAEHLGLSPQKLFDISSKASGQCWSMTSYCPWPDIIDNVPSNNNYEPGFTAQMMLKDLNLSQSAATSSESNTPLGAKATELYDSFVQKGFGQKDFSAIIQFLEQQK